MKILNQEVISQHTGAKFKITGITEDSIILNMALNIKFTDMDKHLINDEEQKSHTRT